MAALALPAISAASKIIGSELAAHTARLKDATSENEALDQVIPAFDSDLLAIQNAYNTGTDANECIAALETVDTNIFNYLRALVGKPGTAWGGPTTQQIGAGLNPTYSADCNKTCTAACCVYLNDLRPAIFGRSNKGSVLNSGMIPAIVAGGGSVVVPEVAPPPNTAYGNYERDSYTLEMKPPALGLSLASQVLSVTGVNVTAAPPSPSLASVSSLFGSLTGGKVITILGVVGGLILVVTALFGQNALRVDR